MASIQLWSTCVQPSDFDWKLTEGDEIIFEILLTDKVVPAVNLLGSRLGVNSEEPWSTNSRRWWRWWWWWWVVVRTARKDFGKKLSDVDFAPNENAEESGDAEEDEDRWGDGTWKHDHVHSIHADAVTGRTDSNRLQISSDPVCPDASGVVVHEGSSQEENWWWCEAIDPTVQWSDGRMDESKAATTATTTVSMNHVRT